MIVTTPYQEPPEGYPGGRVIGAGIRARRLAVPMTLRRCAESMGTTMTEWSRVERGERALTASEQERFDRLTRRARCASCCRQPGPAPFNRYGEPDGHPDTPLGPLGECERCGAWLCPDCIDSGECCEGVTL